MHMKPQSQAYSPGYMKAKAIWNFTIWFFWLLKLLIMGAVEALADFYRRLKLLVLTLTPGQELELESDRAGRAAELRVSSL